MSADRVKVSSRGRHGVCKKAKTSSQLRDSTVVGEIQDTIRSSLSIYSFTILKFDLI